MTRTQDAFAAFEKRARDTRDKWIAEWSKGDKIEKEVREKLRGRIDAVVRMTLGIRQSWHSGGEWELDYTNGRKPYLYQAIDERVRAVTVQVVAEALEDPPKFNKAQREAIRKAYIDQLVYQARDLAGEKAAHDAHVVLDRVLAELDDNELRFCTRCGVRHLEPLHDEPDPAAEVPA